MKPSINRSVHYYPAFEGALEQGPHAAIITGIGIVYPDGPSGGAQEVALQVFANPYLRAEQNRIGGIPEHGRLIGVPFAETPKVGCWSWPPRVSP